MLNFGEKITIGSFMDYFNNRRTVRTYSDRYVDDSLIKEMIEKASHAPNTGNMQQYSVIVTRSPEGKKALAPAHFNQPSVTGASAVLTFCLDFNRFERWCRLNDAQPGYDNFQAFVWGVIDTTIFAQQFCTIAEMKGLGCCYLGTTTYNATDIARTLNLPDRVVPVVTLTLGWPEGNSALSDRLPVEGIMHTERYADYSDETIRRLYSYKESLPESKRFVEENGKQTLAQVFTDVRYTREACEHFSKLFHEFVEAKGFKL